MSQVHFQELTPFQFVILVLSVFVLGIIGLEILIELPHEVVRVLNWIDDVVCVVFFFDFVSRLHRAESKRGFLKWGWLDLLASIPAVQSLRWARIFRVIRILRLLWIIHSLRKVMELLFRNRAGGGVASVFLITFLVISLSASGILMAELGTGGPIHTAEDAVWWSVVTVTTVGYGDLYPVTTAGRMIAAVLMFCGVGLFGTLSGVIASFFLGGQKSEGPAPETHELAEKIAALQQELAALREKREDGR